MTRFLIGFLLFSLPILTGAKAEAKPVSVLCAESVWCDIASQLAGPEARFQALIVSPGIDPHTLQPTPSMARRVQQAAIVIANGGTYDDWVLPFISAAQHHVIVAEAAGWKEGDNPHLFLDPDIVRRVAPALAEAMIAGGAGEKAEILSRLAAFDRNLTTIFAQLAFLRDHYADAPVAVIEPSGNVLLQKAGLKIVDTGFAFATMHHSGAAPKDMALLEAALRNHQVRVLVVNPAIGSPQIDRIVSLARAEHIPLLAIGESLPPGKSWQDWVGGLLTELRSELKRP